MAAIQGVTRNFYKKFAFRIEIFDIASFGFQTCGEISIEVAKIEHFEGGALIPQKDPGRVTVPDVELTRGATNDLDLFLWMQEVVALGGILSDDTVKRSLDIVQTNRNGIELRRWTLINAWPMKWVAGDWDNNADEATIEKVTLAYDYPTLGGEASA